VLARNVNALAAENADLRRRVAALEQKTSPKGVLVQGVAEAMAQMAASVFGRIRALEQRPIDAVSVDFDYDNERTLTIRNGAATKYFTLPVVLDRGTYQQGKFYSRGDAVTCNGSYWIAQEPTMVKPGGNSAWRLSCRSGRDAKEKKS
jgi:hypothetical protein